MFIVTQKRDMVLNVDNVVSVEIDGTKIMAVARTNDYVIGAYKDQDRAKEVFNDMLKTIFQPVIVMKNCKPDESFERLKDLFGTDKVCVIEAIGDSASVEFGNAGVYYMPEN